MDETDRIVLVASGFGIWQGGRHAASARWTDVARVRVSTRDQPTRAAAVTVTLRDGTEVLLPEGLPGSEQFLATAEKALPGMTVRAVWRPKLAESASAGAEVVLFERVVRRPEARA